jgi:opacity protein-like surface antigen
MTAAAQLPKGLPILISATVAHDSHEPLGLAGGDPVSRYAPGLGVRLAVRLPQHVYAGIGLAQWRRTTYADPRGSGFCDCLEYVSFVSQTAASQLFVQWYPRITRFSPYVRAGVGIGAGEWFRWGVANVEHGWRTDHLAAIGAGLDVKILNNTYLTFGLDHTRVAVPDTYFGVIRHTTSLGLGLSVH